ncbi:MAG: EAL domain-containing protein [Cellulosilyticaceae bacterium]
MKLSTKTTLIFLITTALSMVVYIWAGQYLSDYVYHGETTRITGITSGAISRVEGEIGKLTGKVKDYSGLIAASKKLTGKFKLNGYEELGIAQKFERDGIEYKLLLDNDLEVAQIYGEPTEGVQGELELILAELRAIITREGPSFTKGIITTEKTAYFVGIDPLIKYPEKKVNGYFMMIDYFDENKILEIGEGMDKDLKLVDTYQHELAESHSAKRGIMVDVVYSEGNVRSYYEIPRIAGEKPYYVQLTEPLVIWENTQETIDSVIYLVTVFSLIVYIALWCIIDKFVIKRLHRVSRGVNQIKESSELSARLDVDQGKDEITTLSKDINSMVEALEQSHTLIVDNEKKYSYLLQTMSNGFARFKIIRDNGKIDAVFEEVNQTFLDLYECRKEDVINKKITEVQYIHQAYDIKGLEPVLETIRQTGEHYSCGEIEIRPDVWVEITLYVIEEDSFAIIWTDITSIKEYSEQMEHMAQYDSLTGLYNRHKLTEMMDELEGPYTVYFMDIDNFKDINDALGHNIGDEVLCEAAKQLLAFRDNKTSVARIGGDEFVLIKEGIFSDEEKSQFAQTILKRINRTYVCGHYTFEISGSIGISSSPEHATEQKNLLRYADIAMYKSKHQGGNGFSIFTTQMLEEIELEVELRDGLANNEFEAFYQPIYDVNKQEIIGAEALVRWIRDGQVIPPFKFIPLAKKTGDIAVIDQLVLEKACRFCKEQRDRGNENFEVSVNASYRWLMQPDVMNHIQEALSAADLAPNGLKLEITEDEVMDNPKHVIQLLKQIKETGIRISLDDFGVGYSSFNYIKMLPIDVLKIDRSLLLEVDKDAKTKSIIETMIKLSHTLGLEVVCEGVETEDQVELLKTVHCDKIQGYFISKPIPSLEFKELMGSQQYPLQH